MSDNVIQDAVSIRDRLLEVAKELRIRARTASTEAGRSLAEMDAATCDAAALMLQKLGTEVTRLREGIGCHYYGQLDRSDLWRMARGWNDEVQ